MTVLTFFFEPVKLHDDVDPQYDFADKRDDDIELSVEEQKA